MYYEKNEANIKHNKTTNIEHGENVGALHELDAALNQWRHMDAISHHSKIHNSSLFLTWFSQASVLDYRGFAQMVQVGIHMTKILRCVSSLTSLVSSSVVYL